MAYDRKNPISAIGKRAYNYATTSKAMGRGEKFIRNYNRLMRVAGSMQERYNNASKGNNGG